MASETKQAAHTPGPWQVDATFPDKSRGHDFEPRVSITAFDLEYHRDLRLADIPDVTSEDSEYMSNARLIATAPELLEFAEKFVDWTLVQNLSCFSLIEQAKAAIQKARGSNGNR